MAYFRCGGGSSGGAKVYLDGKEVNEKTLLDYEILLRGSTN